MRGLSLFTLLFLSFSLGAVAKPSLVVQPQSSESKQTLGPHSSDMEGPEGPSVFSVERKDDFTQFFRRATFALNIASPHLSERSDFKLAALEKVFPPASPSLDVGRLTLAQSDKANSLSEAPRVRSLYSETSVFWYSAGASAFTSLAVRSLVGLPALLVVSSYIRGLSEMGLTGFTALVGTLIIVTAIDAALSALAGQVVFNNMSRFYKTDFLGGFLAQLAGNGLSSAVFFLSFGFGAMALTGVSELSALLGPNAVDAFGIFTLLGAMPMVVIAFIASLAVPAMISAYGFAKTASPRDGYIIDPTWKPMRRAIGPSDRPTIESSDVPFVSERFVIAIPGT